MSGCQAEGDLAETHRRPAEASQGRLANRVLARGDGFRIEKVSYRDSDPDVLTGDRPPA